MNFRQHNSAEPIFKALRLLGLVALIIFLSESSFAQNTKGDRAETSGGGNSRPRENRFKSNRIKKQRVKRTYNTPSRNIFSRARSARHSKNANVYSQKSIYVNNDQRKPQNEQRVPKTRVTARSRSGKSNNVYPQNGRFTNNLARQPQGDRRSPKSRRVAVRSRSGSTKNVYPQYGKFTSNPARKPQAVQRPVSNRSTLARLNRLQGPAGDPRPKKKRKVTPRSASSSFIRHKTINSNAGFWNVKKKGEVAVVKDIAGRPLRAKNYETPRPGIIPQPRRSSQNRKRVGDRPYKGSAGGGYVTASRPQRAWHGDIAKRRIRGRNFTSKSRIEGTPIPAPGRASAKRGDRVFRGRGPSGGYKSATKSSEKRTGISPLPGRAPGIGANGLGNFSGNIKARKPAKGGGSRSGRLWNNQGSAIQGRTPGIGGDRVGTFQGNIKARKQLKGGGSRSGTLWNNQGIAIQGRTPGIGGDRVGTFQGNIKARKQLKGGGSRSGKLWNNQGVAIQGRTPGIGGDKVGTFQGNIKAGRPLKGGGSASGRLWNNNQTPVQGRLPSSSALKVGGYPGNMKRFSSNPGFNNQGEEFTGFIKKGRHLKGGGSVSGKLWNNKGSAIQGRVPSSTALRVGGYPGNIKRFELSPGFSNQGEEFTGFIKAHKPLKGGGSVSGKLWNNKESAIIGRGPSKTALQMGAFRGNTKRFEQNPGFSNQGEEFTGFIKLPKFKKGYLQNPNAAEESILKKRTDKTTYKVDDLQIKVERRDYVKNKNSAEAALKKLAPTSATRAVGELQVKVKQYHYIHNSSSAKEALNVREPGKAFARATDYQGNIKMKKFDLTKMFSERNRELHPDAKFVKINKNNVDEERSFMTNVKLWWSRKFRKNENLPDHLKEKEHKPRYDKHEQGLWND